jgi:hypothetical protein
MAASGRTRRWPRHGQSLPVVGCPRARGRGGHSTNDSALWWRRATTEGRIGGGATWGRWCYSWFGTRRVGGVVRSSTGRPWRTWPSFACAGGKEVRKGARASGRKQRATLSISSSISGAWTRGGGGRAPSRAWLPRSGHASPIWAFRRTGGV